MAPRGRPPTYKTAEEKAEAHRLRNARRQQRHRERVKIEREQEGLRFVHFTPLEPTPQPSVGRTPTPASQIVEKLSPPSIHDDYGVLADDPDGKLSGENVRSKPR
jgi:hypothetical protein